MAKRKLTTKDIARIAVFSAILFIQEEALTFIPNIQLTQLLIAVYYFSFGFKDTIIIVCIHTLLDNLVMGSFSFTYTPAMMLGWILLVVFLHLFRKFKDNRIIIALIVALHSFIYSWLFLLANLITYKGSFIAYLIADIPFEIILLINGFATTFLLFDRLCSLLNKLKK